MKQQGWRHQIPSLALSYLWPWAERSTATDLEEEPGGSSPCMGLLGEYPALQLPHQKNRVWGGFTKVSHLRMNLETATTPPDERGPD